MNLLTAVASKRLSRMQLDHLAKQKAIVWK